MPDERWPKGPLVLGKGSEDYPIAGIVEEKTLYLWRESGAFVSSDLATDNDLVNVKIKKSGWVNIFRKGVSVYFGSVWDRKEIAIAQRHQNSKEHLDTIKIEWEE